MFFLGEDHEEALKIAAKTYGVRYPHLSIHLILLYLLTSSEDIRKHLSDCVTPSLSIRPEAIFKPWQTGSSKGITRLAFNLFNEKALSVDEVPKRRQMDELYMYTPAMLFRHLDDRQARVAVEAISMYFHLFRGMPM